MRKLKIHLGLVLSQLLFAGFEILGRIALDKGVGVTAFTFYRNCLATLFLGSAGIILEHRLWVHLPFRRICYIFFLGFMGVTINQVCYLLGLSLTSVMFASVIRNSIPFFTFFLAVVFKFEKIDLTCLHGRAKLVGAVVGLAGSLILSLYRGPTIVTSNFAVSHPPKYVSSSTYSYPVFNFLGRRIHLGILPWHLGTMLLVISGASFSSFLILQVRVLETYRAPVSFASMCSLSSIIQLPVLTLVFESHWTQWWNRIRFGEALCILYSGVIGSGIVSGIQSWAVHGGGPVIVAAYQPLETLITAFLSFFLLNESLHLGTLLGGFTIILGLYILVWGQRLELNSADGGTNLKNGPRFNSLSLRCGSISRRSSQRVTDEGIWNQELKDDDEFFINPV